MLASLQSRLLAIVLLLLVAAIATGAVMVGLFHQSATARVGEAGAQLEQACEAIADAYRFYSAGSTEASARNAAFAAGLGAVVQSALVKRTGIEGGIWQGEGSLAYAYPTYEGSGPKTDLPEAERSRIAELNRVAAAGYRPSSRRYASASQTLLLTACPLPGPVPNVTAWTMTRVATFAGPAYGQLMSGLGVLLVTVLATAGLLAHLTLSWSRHINGIRAGLASRDLEELPTLGLTGERELDQIVGALNDAGARLATARERARELSAKIAGAERLAAIGRVTAGVAHEIRNPIAAMRLKAENALSKGGDRQAEALRTILEQISRLDRLLRRLLNVTEPEQARLQNVALAGLLQRCVQGQQPLADALDVRLAASSEVESAQLDPELIRLGIDNLLSNAIHAASPHGAVALSATVESGQLVLRVRDSGPGPPEDLRGRLFEPFVTGRADGTGLGLAIVREVAEAHRGSVRYLTGETGTTFEIMVPWQSS